MRFSQVDDLIRPDHYYLANDDTVFFIGDYTARKGYSHSDTNQLILNLKKSPSAKGTPAWKYKMRAIAKAGAQLREALGTGDNLNWLTRATLVPVPPSKAKETPLYDDRMLQVLQVLGQGFALDIRDLVLQRQSMDAAHESDFRPTPTNLLANYYINDEAANPQPTSIGIFDDVLTTGCHFRAIKSLLGERYPGVSVSGIFLARRVPDASDAISDFANLFGPEGPDE